MESGGGLHEVVVGSYRESINAVPREIVFKAWQTGIRNGLISY